jgi:hypothetical protein
VVAVPLGTEKTETYVPGYVTTVPSYYGYGYGYGYWGGYYAPYYQTIYTPGYVDTEQVVRYRIDVWSAEEGGKLVWMGTTETINPTSGDQIRSEVSRLLVDELRRQRVVGKK